MKRVLNGIFCSSPFLLFTPEKSFLYSSMGGSPHDCGVSRRAHQQTRASTMAMAEGTMNAAFHVCSMPIVPKMKTPKVTSSPRLPLPRVCEVFQIDILKLRSFCENQCAIMRPQGGQPIPESQPTMSISRNMTATLRAWSVSETQLGVCER